MWKSRSDSYGRPHFLLFIENNCLRLDYIGPRIIGLYKQPTLGFSSNTRYSLPPAHGDTICMAVAFET
jgi:hypothetical protein